MCEYCPSSGTGRRLSSGAGSRSLVLECECDSGTRRMSWSRVVANGYDVCGRCGSRLFFRCPTAHVELCEARGDDEVTRHPVIAAAERSSLRVVSTLPRTGSVAPRFRCHCCAAFVSGPNARCKSCRSDGPHEFGEDGGKLGNAHRARKRRSEPRRAVTRTPEPDLPF